MTDASTSGNDEDVHGHIFRLWGLYLRGCAAVGSVSAAVIGATGPSIDDYWSGD